MRRPVYPVIARLAFPNNWNFGDRVWKALRDIRAFGGGEREIGSVNGPYSVNSNWNEWRERSTLAVGRNVKYRLGGGAIDWMVTSLVTLDPVRGSRCQLVSSGNTRNCRDCRRIFGHVCVHTRGQTDDEILVTRNSRILRFRQVEVSTRCSKFFEVKNVWLWDFVFFFRRGKYLSEFR